MTCPRMLLAILTSVGILMQVMRSASGTGTRHLVKSHPASLPFSWSEWSRALCKYLSPNCFRFRQFGGNAVFIV